MKKTYVANTEDAKSLQKDLDSMTAWSKRWAMEFHPQKCQVLTISRKKNPVKFHYKMGAHTLERVSSAKYLGLTITEDLRWNQHIDNICKKGNGVLAFVKRNLRIPSKSIKTNAYKTLVRPTLEYASSVWDPHTQTNIDKIEAIQRRAARFVMNRFHNTSSPTEMLEELKWPSLASRRETQRLIIIHKMHHNHIVFNLNSYLTPSQRPSRLENSASYNIPRSIKDFHLHSFFPKTTRQWNRLPENAVTTIDPEAFKNIIKRHNKPSSTS